MFDNCQDAMAICKNYGYPDLFLTFTCNPKWIEIGRHLARSANQSPYRLDISCRVFQLKLEEMMNDFKEDNFLEESSEVSYSLVSFFVLIFLLIFSLACVFCHL